MTKLTMKPTLNVACTLLSLAWQALLLRSVLATLLLAPLAALQSAELKLATPFSDHMVLQRDKPVAVWGWADAGESVTVSFAGQSKSATAGTDGKWSLKLDALTASAEPRALLVTGKEGRKIEVKDVLVGEVWLGSGQSNMEMAVGGANNAAAEQAAANFPLIRYYAESSAPAETPQPEGKGLWQPCTPTNVRRFSATLYFFGREIHREVGVPVGLICSAVGATHIEAWISAEAQSADGETKAEYDSQLRGWQHFDEAKLRADYPKKLAAWKLAVE
jgi:sialate O-acetylesterase